MASGNTTLDQDCSCVFIALGSNLDSPSGTPFQNLQSALRLIDDNRALSIIKSSSCYISKPHGPRNQQDFFNAVIEVQCSLEPLALLHVLQGIENQHGRIRSAAQHWGPRTLDLDILLFSDLQMNSKDLTLPHKEIANREFVLLPLLEIAPELIFPSGKKLKSLAENCCQNGIIKLEQSLWPS